MLLLCHPTVNWIQNVTVRKSHGTLVRRWLVVINHATQLQHFGGMVFWCEMQCYLVWEHTQCTPGIRQMISFSWSAYAERSYVWSRNVWFQISRLFTANFLSNFLEVSSQDGINNCVKGKFLLTYQIDWMVKHACIHMGTCFNDCFKNNKSVPFYSTSKPIQKYETSNDKTVRNIWQPFKVT